ncbi:MAG: tetratricopeptide repeat protein, partial [Candidatus Rokuibacteriota bacterium]
MMRRVIVLALMWVATMAATPVPPTLPPPDLAPLVPWASAPLDKPAVELPQLALPPSPADVLTVAPATVALPEAQKPTEPLPAPRTLPCVGAWLRIASESLECGRAKLGRGELDEAARALEQAARPGPEPDVVAEARYWHAETLYRLGQFERADWLFRQVVTDPARTGLGPWARFGGGFTALRLGDAVRAEDAFRRVLGAVHPVALDGWARHGLALALYAQRRWKDAEKTWADATARRLPAGLERDVLFWHGDTLGRVDQPPRAVEKLASFTQGGPHPLLTPGHVRLGWWSLAADAPAEGLKALRAALASAPTSGPGAREREWAEAGLALALSATGDLPGARAALAPLDGRRSTLALPVRLRLIDTAVKNGPPPEALALAQDLLSGNLTPPVRAWVLLVKGEAHRAEGNRDEARTQFDLARGGNPQSDVGRHARLRIAQTNFELREFSQAVADVGPLLAEAVAPEMRVAVLLVQGEAAYHAGSYPVAAEAYRRLLVEFPAHELAPAVRLALAWAVLRQGQRDAALQRFLEFAKLHPTNAHAVDALVLASELYLAGGDLPAARSLLDRIVTDHGGHPRAELARLNRALLLLRAGQPLVAERELAAWINRAPFPALLGRAQAALGVALLGQGRA